MGNRCVQGAPNDPSPPRLHAGSSPCQFSTNNIMKNMATFHPNPNPDSDPRIEKSALEGSGFRVWHVMFICFAALIGIVILICCCVKIRIPRTKQEIEANFRRKRLVEKFRERIRLIQNQELDAIDLQRALEIIQADYKSEVASLENLTTACDVTNNLKPPISKFNKIKQLIRFKSNRSSTSAQPEMQC